MSLIVRITSKAFHGMAYILFDRKRSLIFCLFFSFASLLIEAYFDVKSIFSCSGAIFTIAGLFLNIKHGLHFHLKVPKKNIYNKMIGAGLFGVSELTKYQEDRVDNLISDEIFGVSFMVVGTLIWAYGSYLFV